MAATDKAVDMARKSGQVLNQPQKRATEGRHDTADFAVTMSRIGQSRSDGVSTCLLSSHLYLTRADGVDLP